LEGSEATVTILAVGVEMQPKTQDGTAGACQQSLGRGSAENRSGRTRDDIEPHPTMRTASDKAGHQRQHRNRQHTECYKEKNIAQHNVSGRSDAGHGNEKDGAPQKDARTQPEGVAKLVMERHGKSPEQWLPSFVVQLAHRLWGFHDHLGARVPNTACKRHITRLRPRTAADAAGEDLSWSNGHGAASVPGDFLI